jgi:ATP-dependent DNA helicase DinG
LANLAVQNDTIEALARRASELRNELAAILDSDSREHVYWYELRGRGVFLWASPIRVASVLKERLFEQTDSVVLTSATLATGNNFEFIRAPRAGEFRGADPGISF